MAKATVKAPVKKVAPKKALPSFVKPVTKPMKKGC